MEFMVTGVNRFSPETYSVRFTALDPNGEPVRRGNTSRARELEITGGVDLAWFIVGHRYSWDTIGGAAGSRG